MLKRITALAVMFVFLLGAVSGPAARAAGSEITLYEPPANDPDEIEIVKESSGKTITDGTAYFKVEYYANNNWSGKATRTWYYKTVDGVTRLGNATYYTASCPYGTSDALYTNAMGMPTLPLGVIRVTEVQPPEGYLKSDFHLDGKITQPSAGADGVFQWVSQADNIIRYASGAAYIHNDQIKGRLKIVKRDAYDDTPLAGVGFRILDGEDKTIAEGYTDENGEVTFENLPYGKNYFYQEFKAPKGYELNEAKTPFAITENGVTVTKEQTNRRREATLQVKKQDTDGSALSGAVFLLEYSVDNGTVWLPVSAREAGNNVTIGGCTSPGLKDGQLTTGADGIVTFTGLRADSGITYRLTETAAPKGMSLLSSPFYVGTLPVKTDRTDAADSQSIGDTVYCYALYITAADDYVFRLPLTGSDGFAWLPLAMTLTAVPMVFVIKRKEKSK